MGTVRVGPEEDPMPDQTETPTADNPRPEAQPPQYHDGPDDGRGGTTRVEYDPQELINPGAPADAVVAPGPESPDEARDDDDE